MKMKLDFQKINGKYILLAKGLSVILSGLFFYICVNFDKLEFLGLVVTSTSFAYGISIVELGLINYLVQKGKFLGFDSYIKWLIIYAIIVSITILIIKHLSLFDVSEPLLVLLLSLFIFNTRFNIPTIGDKVNQFFYLGLCAVQNICLISDEPIESYKNLVLCMCLLQIAFVYLNSLTSIKSNKNADSNILYYLIVPLSGFVFLHLDKLFLMHSSTQQAGISIIERCMSAASLYMPFITSFWAESRRDSLGNKSELYYIFRKNKNIIIFSMLLMLVSVPISNKLIFQEFSIVVSMLSFVWFFFQAILNVFTIIFLKNGWMKQLFIIQFSQMIIWTSPKLFFESLSINEIIAVNILAVVTSLSFSCVLYSKKRVLMND